LVAVRRYLAATAILDLAWEAAQMPLYTLWQTGTHSEIAFAVLHCTGGDIVIAAAALLAALVAFGVPEWPLGRRWRVDTATIVVAIAYTAVSEHLNTVRGAWAYSDLMPTLPWVGTGLAPVAQWLLVPVFALRWAYRGGRTPDTRRKAAATHLIRAYLAMLMGA
jgi:hypothetical protein